MSPWLDFSCHLTKFLYKKLRKFREISDFVNMFKDLYLIMYFVFQEALGSLSSSNGSDRNFSKESKKAEKMASSPPPKPQLPVQPASATSVSAIEANKEAANTLDDSAKKPDWLAELSRKQVRK